MNNEPGFSGGEEMQGIPARASNVIDPSEYVEVEVKESVVVDELLADGKVIEEVVLKVVEIDIEGRKHKWHKETITAAEVANLGGWSVSEGVLHIDAENRERTIAELEEVRIEVGVSFAKRVRFKRG